MQNAKSKARRRRRNCYDRARRWALEQRQRRKPNPASRAAAEFFLLFAVLVGSMPMPTPVLSPLPKPRRKSAKTPVPAKTNRAAYQRYDDGGWPSRYGGAVPPFSRLLRDVRRPWREEGGAGKLVHEDAIQVLRQRAEPDVLFWLDDIIRRKSWGDLAAVIRPGSSDDDVHRDMLRAAIAWTRVEREDAPKAGDAGKKGKDETPDNGDDWTKKGPK